MRTHPSARNAVILGAGFSRAAGLPLTRDLFASPDAPRAQTASAAAHHAEVRQAYLSWKSEHPEEHAEQWLAYLYEMHDNPLQSMLHGTTWSEAVRYALSQLVILPPGSNSHYYYGICSSQCHPTHRRFWDRVISEFPPAAIVTLNYDILIEQALHSDPSPHRTAPDCYYGGFQYLQHVRKMTDVVTKKAEEVRLGNKYPLYKLHGSVNWAWERHSPSLKIHQDVRAVFRHDDAVGVPAIVPPIPEKEMPPEFGQIWQEAKKVLTGCENWIICGYSLPAYDIALAQFFAQILQQRKKTTIFLLDPYSGELAERWENLASGSVRVIQLPGIPEALDLPWA